MHALRKRYSTLSDVLLRTLIRSSVKVLIVAARAMMYLILRPHGNTNRTLDMQIESEIYNHASDGNSVLLVDSKAVGRVETESASPL